MHSQFQDPAPADGAAIAAAIREQLRSQVHEAASTSMPLGGEPPVSLMDQAAIGAGCLARSLESFERLKFAAAEVSACAKRIGTPPPKPPTLRGGFGAFVIRLIGRALWWYTQPMQDFAAALGRRQEQDVETCACLVQAQDVISGSLNDLRQQVQQLQAALAVAQTRFGLRCSELESAQIQAQSAQIDHVTSAELSQGLGGLTQSLESVCASISAIDRASEEQAALLVESQVKLGVIQARAESGGAKLENLDRAHKTLAAGIGRLEEKVDTAQAQVLSVLAAEEQARAAEVSRIEQKIEAIGQQTDARLAAEEQARTAEVSRVEQKIEAIGQQTDARLGAEEQARTAEVSRVEQKIEAVERQTDARLGAEEQARTAEVSRVEQKDRGGAAEPTPAWFRSQARWRNWLSPCKRKRKPERPWLRKLRCISFASSRRWTPGWTPR